MIRVGKGGWTGDFAQEGGGGGGAGSEEAGPAARG